MSDYLHTLPTDKSTISNEDIQIVDQVFEKNIGTFNKIFSEFKEAVLAGLLYAIFSLPQIDNLIRKFIPITNNSNIILLVIKVLLFIVLFYVVKNFALARKN